MAVSLDCVWLFVAETDDSVFFFSGTERPQVGLGGL